tara:strand:- start:1994 stop:2971 length:978 start_codon:yes stop_codon:yes gene_type:complete
MTGLTDSDANPVHSVAEVEGLNLLEPASKKEFITKNLYPGWSRSIVRNVAKLFLFLEESKEWILQNRGLLIVLSIVLSVPVILIVRELVSNLILLTVWLLDEKWVLLTTTEQLIVSAGSMALASPFGLVKLIPIKPLSANRRNRKFEENCREILIGNEHPNWVNKYLYEHCWPNLAIDENKNDTREQGHRDIAYDTSTEFGSEDSSWYSMNQHCREFLKNWSKEKPEERIPIALWAFNPPESADDYWGEKRDYMITFAQTKFALEIYPLLYNLDGGAVLHEFIQQAEENGKSFEWLKEQITGTPRLEVPCVQLLQLWCQSHNSND